MKRRLSYTFLVLLLAAGASATPVIRLTQQEPYLRIGEQAGWFADKSARLTLDEIRQPANQALFKPGKHQTGAFGLTRAAIWVQGSSGNSRLPLRLVLCCCSLCKTGLFVVTVYVFDRDARNPYVWVVVVGFCSGGSGGSEG